jgi:cyanophycinase-like exopeptidase
MAGNVYLVGSGQGSMLADVAKRACADVGKAQPHVAVSYAPVAGDAGGLKFMSERMPRLFPGATIERFAVQGEHGATDPERARAVLDRADLVFVSGGDPTLGAKVLGASGASTWLRAARARGTAMMGVSAGSIVLGAWWADWPEDDDGSEEEQFARTGLVECAGVVAGHVFDTHNEEDDWDELRLVAKLLARRGEHTQLLGIPSGGALVFAPDGGMEVVGESPFRLR